MARRHRYHGRSRSGHAARKWVSLAGKVIGGLVVAGPAITEISTDINSPQKIPNGLLYNYTGFNANTGTFNAGQLGVGAGSIVGGLVLIKVFSYLAKRF